MKRVDIKSLLDTYYWLTKDELRALCLSALDDCEKKLRKYEMKHGASGLSLSQSYQAGRLRALEDEINGILTDLSGNMYDTLKIQSINAYQTGVVFNNYLIDNSVPFSVPFSGVNKHLMMESVSKEIAGLTLKDRVTPERLNLLFKEREAVAKGAMLGWGEKKTALQIQTENLREGIDKSYKQCLNIARTELTRNCTAGYIQNQAELRSEYNLDIRSKWLAANGERTRESHLYLRGKEASVWRNGRYEFEWNGHYSPGPGMWGIASMDCNCRCRNTSIVKGYEEFYPTENTYLNWVQQNMVHSDNSYSWDMGAKIVAEYTAA